MKLTTTYQALLDSLRIEFEKEQELKRMKLHSKPKTLEWLGITVPETLNFTRRGDEYVDIYVQTEWVTYANMVRTVAKAVQALTPKVSNSEAQTVQ